MLQTRQNSLGVRFEAQCRAFEKEPFPSLDVRKDRLKRLLALTERHEAEICAAIDSDFSGRAQQETRLAELFVVRAGIGHAIRHLRGWMRERRVATSLPFLPGRNRLLPQPLGVVGIVSPWNYPFQLAIAPATAALAAGNRVLIKPSELTPKFSDLLARLVEEHFSPDEMSVVVGDADVGKTFVSMPFDHLLFTGSTAVGRQVALAAAANLTPVTLELGGKSPAIFDSSCDLDTAVSSVAYGKLLNAGQTCIAPDYLMVPRGQGAAIATKLAAAMARLYPRLRNNPDYTAIVSERHHQRLNDMIAEARESGADVVEVNPANEKLGVTDRKMAPVLVRNAGENLRLMREEIFGPVLPILEYGTVDEAIEHVNRGERPLALYWFGRDSASRQKVMQETVAGGVTVNDCMMHLVQERQPFGGVGESGMGAYHGEWGFRTFSKEKPIFVQSRLSAGGLLRPPYGRTFERLFRLLNLIS
ncbi:aldehyde dehydrogenase [Mesorhizobium loti]|uniref:Aldehyde dehydrogenase n=1 Tax=Rhizobium loti TaxID=381 RepID=A0A117N1D2_RHILI|nr:aldehyde dehydrogenase [Mesorhizobium loti]